MSSTRVKWVDMAKGIGMIFIMIGHTYLPYSLFREVYTFHVPLFFFMSGYLVSTKKHDDFRYFIKKKITSLIIPLYLFILLNYAYWILIIRTLKTSEKYINVFSPLTALYWGKGNIIGALWFIPCLFLVEVLFYLIIRISKNDKKKITCALLILSLVGCVYTQYVKIDLPWSLDTALIAILFYGCGFLYKENSEKFTKKIINIKTNIVFLVVNVIVGYLNTPVDMIMKSYGNYILFYISAFSGIVAIIIFVQLIKESTILSFIGKNSLLFLAIHLYYIFPIIKRIIAKFPILNTQNNYIYLINSMIYITCTSIILIPIVWGVNKYLPILVGKKHTNSIKTMST